MTILSGSRLGPYEILSVIGAGGMGEVCRARDTRLSSSLEYALYYLRPPICHELHQDNDKKYGNATGTIFYLRHGVNTILFPGDMTPSTNKLIRHHVIHTNCCRGRPVMGDTKVVLLKLGYEDRRSGLKDCRNMPDLIVMVSIFLVINIDKSGSRNVNAFAGGIVSHVVIVAHTRKTSHHLARVSIQNN